ncbi:MAG TPA: hypothetical protein VMV69_28715 [Pirellulales bacterium]|nr:hypothetical protein [Pirellulales bacterium]
MLNLSLRHEFRIHAPPRELAFPPHAPIMTTTPAKPLTDSPWFWVLLFGSMALALLATIEPKFTKRYERLERMHQARNEVALRSAAAGVEEVAEAGDGFAESVALHSGGGTLRPLMFFLAGLMFMATLAMAHWRRPAEKSR